MYTASFYNQIILKFFKNKLWIIIALKKPLKYSLFKIIRTFIEH